MENLDYEPGSNFRAWAFAYRAIQGQGAPPQADARRLPLDEDLAEQLAEADEDPAQIDERISASTNARAPAGDHRQLINQRYFSGGSLEDFSVVCGRSVNSLRITLYRLRAATRSHRT